MSHSEYKWNNYKVYVLGYTWDDCPRTYNRSTPAYSEEDAMKEARECLLITYKKGFILWVDEVRTYTSKP